MKKYFVFFRLGLMESLLTRGHVFYWVLVDVIAVGMMPFLWIAVVNARGEPLAGFGVAELITYFLGSVIIWQILVTYPFSPLIKDIQRGDLANDLIRPYSYFFKLFFFQSGHRVIRFLFALPFIAAVLIFFARSIVIPSSWIMVMMLSASLIVAYFLIYCMHFLVGTVAFWFDDEGQGVIDAWLLIFMLLSGDFAPLTFFPNWLFKIASFLPFQYVINFPLQIYLGRVPLVVFYIEIIRALIWLFVLYGAYVIVWKRGVQSFTGVGR